MSQPCNKFSVAELSVEEQAVLAFCGKVGCTCINSNLRGYKVGDFKHGHLAPLLQQMGYKLPNDAGKRMLWRGVNDRPPNLECNGEVFYVDLGFQFGKRLIVANATGLFVRRPLDRCILQSGQRDASTGMRVRASMHRVEESGKGTAWGNSLFEDNAEYGLGQVIHVRQRRRQLRDRVEAALARAGKSLSVALRSLLEQWLEFGEDSVISERLSDEILPLLEEIAELIRLKDMFTKPSMWMFGGDGWANDIGYGGIDHAIASGNNVKIVVLDTEVYSNTGGQSSKSTPMGAVAKFAQAGRDQRKKDLGAMAMAYQHVYVASVAIGANYKQCVEAFAEAEKYDGPALLMCYAPCIEHRFFKTGLSAMSLDQRDAVECGYWPLYRFNPKLAKAGDNPFILAARTLGFCG
ncbi:unnamed protein product [Symbiodinium natans]|uniref:Thiamine pyrophosphate enzyme TPP-binding domain-containing protein n=1 Tax=Symbiodinium natans TaxID=878477 RepID=A0A812T573_9DINO|nr:unnamed protein product [Symbiodinium natans]